MSASEPGRYLGALRYYAPVTLALAAVVSGATYGVLNAHEEDYRATVRIAKQEVAPSAAAAGEQSLARELQTLAELVTTRPVMKAAAGQIDKESEATLRERVHASVDPGTNILRIVVEDDVPEEARKSAGVVSGTFLAVRAGVVRGHLASVRKDLARRIRAARPPSAAAPLQARQREVAASEALAGSDLLVVEAPVTPKSRPSSSAVPEAAIAFAAAVLLGVIAALLREHIVPRVHSVRQLSRLVGLDIIGEVPRNPRRLGRENALRAAGENAAYQLARSALERELVSDGSRILVVTSAFEGEGKTTATANLGRAFADAGSDVLLVSGDARKEDLASAFGLESERGFWDLLAGAKESPGDLVIDVAPEDGRGAKLAVLPAGRPPESPEAVTETEVAKAVAHLRALPYDVILVDSAPLLGAAEAQLLARDADQTVLVARSDRLSEQDALDLRDAIRRLGLTRTHFLVLGAAVARNRVPMSRAQEAEAVTPA